MAGRLKQILFVFFIFQSLNLFAEKYWVSFTDKSGVEFDPYEYFSQRTIEQRVARGIDLCDEKDFPVNENYCTALQPFCDSISYSSRWLNGVAIYSSPDRIDLIKNLSFVSSVREMSGQITLAFKSDKSYDLNKFNFALLHYQTDRLGGRLFGEKGIDGKGIRIAVLDAGFKGADENAAFIKLRNEKRIIATYDFVRKKENVFVSHWHGSAALSCIVGELDSIKIGLATGAEILLARTERVSSERMCEEENWLAAAEWADKNGANIISSSLGYTNNRYFNNEMNGRNSLIAMAATIAASKGILVVNSAGNDAQTNWHFVDTPADADSVLAVGGTDPETDLQIYFSSVGPTSDGRLKPNVTAPALVVAASTTGIKETSGTSFSAPLVAGFAACAWQTNPTMSNMQLFHEIEMSGHLYPYFDFAHGYGIPQAKYFTDTSRTIEPTFDFVIINDQIKVVLREKFSYPDQEIALGYKAQRNLFYKVTDKYGSIKSYTVFLAGRKEMLNLQAQDFQEGDEVTVHFEGYTSKLDFPKIESEEIK